MCTNKHEVTSTSKAYPKEKTPMRLTKRSLIKTAAIGSAFVGALAVAAPASANSFGPTDYGTYGQAKVSYDDANDLFCIESTNPGGTEFYLAPTTKVGPQMTSHVRYGQESCYSLATAYEDTPYLYYIFDGPHILSGTTIEVHFYS